jgi:hypothetical protein
MTKMAACVTILYRGGTIASLFSSTVVSLTCDYPPELFPVGHLHDELPHNRAGYGTVNLRTIRSTIQPVLVAACAGTHGGHSAFTDHRNFKSFAHKPSTYRGAGSGALGYFFWPHIFHLQELGKVSNILAEVQGQSTQTLRSSIIPMDPYGVV